MIFTETKLKGAFLVELKLIEDDRGFFARAWCNNELKAQGLSHNLVQANTAYSKKSGTLRGIHFQNEPHQEAKLVKCIQGAIFDVIVDIRPASSTFGQWYGVELSAKNRKMLYVPEGFGHAYLTLADATEVYYSVTEFYHPESEGGIRWDDPEIGIEWPIKPTVISDKDQALPNLSSIKTQN